MGLDGSHRCVAQAVERMALPSRHLRVAQRREGDRAHAFAVRNHARLPRPRHSGVSLHDRRGGRHRHPLLAVRDVRHAGTVGSCGARARWAPRVPAGAPRDDRDRSVAYARTGAGRRSGDARRNVLARAADRRAYAAAAGRIGHGAKRSSPTTARHNATVVVRNFAFRAASMQRPADVCLPLVRSLHPFCAHCISGVFRCALYVSSS